MYPRGRTATPLTHGRSLAGRGRADAVNRLLVELDLLRDARVRVARGDRQVLHDQAGVVHDPLVLGVLGHVRELLRRALERDEPGVAAVREHQADVEAVDAAL